MKKKGFALLTVIIITAFLITVGLVTVSNAGNVIKINNTYEKDVDNSKLSLESGIEMGYSWLRKYISDDKYNGSVGIIKDNLNIGSINNKNINTKITADSQYFYIEARTDNKSMKAQVKKIVTTEQGEGTDTKIVLNQPVAMMVPGNSSIFYKDDSVERPINVQGVNPLYHFYKVLNYNDNSKVYDITKNNWGTNVSPSIDIKSNSAPPMNVEFKSYSLTPFQYSNATIVIPKYTFTKNKKAGTITKVNNGSANKSGNTYYSTTNGYEIVYDSTSKVTYWYIDGDLTISGDNAVDQNLNQIVIVASGTVNINATKYVNIENVNIYANNIKINGYNDVLIQNSKFTANRIDVLESDDRVFTNCNITTTQFYVDGSSVRTFDNTKVFADYFKVSGSGERYFKNNSEVNSKTMIVDCSNPVYFDSVKIYAESFDVKGSTKRQFSNSEIKSNNFTIVATNDTAFKNVIITAGNININGSCSRVFENTTIISRNLLMDSTNIVEFKGSKIFVNYTEIKGSVDRNFNDSIIVSDAINIQTTNNINFNNSFTMTSKLTYKANDIIFNSITDINKLNNYFSQAQDYVKVNSGTPTAVTTKYDLEKLEYLN